MASTTTMTSPTPPLPDASPLDALSRFVRNTFLLQGRASRSEYWWWMLTNVIVLVMLRILAPLLAGDSPSGEVLIGPFGSGFLADLSLLMLYPSGGPTTLVGTIAAWAAVSWAVLTFIPGVTVAVRRLHDSNLSGWWALLALAPLGQLVLLILAIRRPRLEGARFDSPLTSRSISR